MCFQYVSVCKHLQICEESVTLHSFYAMGYAMGRPMEERPSSYGFQRPLCYFFFLLRLAFMVSIAENLLS